MARQLADIRWAALNISAAFEGKLYSAYRSDGPDIIQYGRFSFSLASGDLLSVVGLYLQLASGPTADGLHAYLPRLQAKDETLRHDTRFKDLLLKAADEPAMQAAQDAIITAKTWDLVQPLSIQPRNIQTPLGQALLFDMALLHGPRHNMVWMAETELGVPSKSPLPHNDITEETLLAKLVEVQQQRLNTQADELGQPALRARGDFWASQVSAGDWQLSGDAQGLVKIGAGEMVRVRVPGDEPAPPPTDSPAPPPEKPATVRAPENDTIERIKNAAFNITAAFEGSGYASYQNHDKGIISYGRFQFTLASGSLFSVLEKYLQAASGPTAERLQNEFLTRIHNRDETLRHDNNLRTLLLEAANEAAMQTAQNALATSKYWDLVQRLSIQPRNIQTPLGQALIFDMAINHGPRHDMIGLAEEALGVPPKSRMPDNGASEQDLITHVARIRQERLQRLAEKENLPGLKQRGDFWVALVKTNDWHLQGDEDGIIKVKPQRSVQVRAPQG